MSCQLAFQHAKNGRAGGQADISIMIVELGVSREGVVIRDCFHGMMKGGTVDQLPARRASSYIGTKVD